MSRTFVCGDTHNTIDIQKLRAFAEEEGKNLSKEDYVIIAGDFGGIWNNYSDIREKELLREYNGFPWTTLFIDGNHENFDRLFSPEFPVRYHPDLKGNVSRISESVFRLRRGHVYQINGNTIFTMGGGVSMDKGNRAAHISWWAQELPTAGDYIQGLDNLKFAPAPIDFVISHTCPEKVYQRMLVTDLRGFNLHMASSRASEDERNLRGFLDEVDTLTRESRIGWYFGHFHTDQVYEIDGHYYHCLYNRAPMEISKWNDVLSPLTD